MPRLVLLILVCLCPLSRTVAAGEMVYPDGSPPAYISMPGEPGERHPAVFLIHEWWGLDAQTKETADQLASHGFLVYAVDLYYQQTTRDPVKAYELSRLLETADTRDDLWLSFQAMLRHPSVDADRAAVVGKGMGARWALELSLDHPGNVKALALYYGDLITDDKELNRIKFPILGFYGEKDVSHPVTEVQDFEFRAAALGKRAEIIYYPEAQFGFASPQNEFYRPRDSEDAREKLIAFLKANLI